MTSDKYEGKRQPPRISLFIGTKAQFIKMIPVAWELNKRDLAYRLINTGQHQSISDSLRRQYDIGEPDYSLGKQAGNVNTLLKGIGWSTGLLWTHGFSGDRTRRELFDNQTGVVLVHGDTASTLLSAFIAKRAGQKVMHIEAGLRSWQMWNPFPEELIRILVMKMSDVLIAPSLGAYDNLMKMSLKGRCEVVGGNTGLDIVAADLKRHPKETVAVNPPYSIATIHRMETLYSRSRMEMMVEAVIQAQRKAPVIFVQHEPTVARLSAYKLMSALDCAGVTQIPLLEHSEFVHLINGAEFILTDGGSVQEEASYLGVPCLLMRKATERCDGIGGNVVLSKLDPVRVNAFIDEYERYRRAPVDFGKVGPSVEIVDILQRILT